MSRMLIQGAGELEPLGRPRHQVQRFPATCHIRPRSAGTRPARPGSNAVRRAQLSRGLPVTRSTLQTGPCAARVTPAAARRHAQLADHVIGEIFGRAATFLKLTVAKATSATEISVQAAR